MNLTTTDKQFISEVLHEAIDGLETKMFGETSRLDGKITGIEHSFTSLEGKFTGIDSKFTRLEDTIVSEVSRLENKIVSETFRLEVLIEDGRSETRHALQLLSSGMVAKRRVVRHTEQINKLEKSSSTYSSTLALHSRQIKKLENGIAA